ncbi:MAG TPA: DNA/RNA non-specific endonuclease [Collinsella ihuae]|uniref:DNA/RNA non-specific endonuclease n=1 Tax=Collinsella ihumii TaxID=1720204 RepID=A0A921IQX2_9ACTN|nr:DNA/RNA non-specific endonuclease [Collinsella ihumii]
MVARKRSGLSVPVIVVALLLVIGAFSGEPSASSARDQAAAPATEQVQAAPASPESPDPQTPAASTPSEAPAASETPASPGTPDAPAQQAQAFDYAQVPPYTGSPYTEIDGNVPALSTEDAVGAPAESYAPLDALGRCGAAFAIVSLDTMPTEERGSIGMIRPSGWHTVRYDDLVDGRYLYNRCHLLGFQLTAENANERNLITGTRYMNVEGMLPFENQVASYVERTGNRVLMRSTPVFVGDELVARGVHLEALSIDDGGAGVSFNVFCYNVQPGIEIDYATGDSRAQQQTQPASPEAPAPQVTYILNTNSRKFHYPDCHSVDQMAEHNKREVTDTRDSLIAQGYEPCGNCNP